MNALNVQKITSKVPKLLNQVESLDDLFTIYELDTELQAAHRIQHFSKDCETKDIFTRHWMLWVGHLSPGSVYLKAKGQWVELSGPCALYIPPFSLLQWKIKSGIYEWVGLSWESELKSLPKFAFVSPWSFNCKINSLSDLNRIFQAIVDRKEVCHEDFPSAVASKVKKYLDLNYASPLRLVDISTNLKIPHSTISHYFKKSFGLSPVEYRKRLRSAESLRLLIGGKQSPNQVIIKTGFEDYSQFYRSIRATYGSSPNKYSTK